MTTTSDKPRAKSFSFNKGPKRTNVVLTLNGETIKCKSSMDGLAVLDFSAVAALAESEDAGEQAKAAGAVKSFLQEAVLEWDKFEAVVKAEDSGIGPEELGEVAGWLIEQYVERPTE